MEETGTVTESTSRIVASYVRANTIAPEALSSLIREVGRSLGHLGQTSAKAVDSAPRPAVPPKKSVGKEELVCLECGARMRMLKRHLINKHTLTPDAYRERYGLASDYPMVAPNYSARRSEIAKEIGLGNTSNQAG
jgi:predicted transcriptional regulator